MEQKNPILLLQEQEVEEEDVSLLRKSSVKTKNNGNHVAAEAGNDTVTSYSYNISSNSESFNIFEAEIHEGEQNGVANCCQGEEKDAKKEENGSSQGHSVFLDKDQGMWKCRHCDWTYLYGHPWVDHDQDLKGCTDMPMNVDIFSLQGSSLVCEKKGSENNEESSQIEHNFVKHSVDESDTDGKRSAATKKHENQEYRGSETEQEKVMTKEEEKGFGLPSEPFGELQQEEITNDGSTVKDNIDEIEVEEEPTEYDVETVINKQNTHDLYCPNCHSCITKKVILRRKRRVKNFRTKSRRGKVDNVPVPDLADGSSKTPDTQPKFGESPAFPPNTHNQVPGEDVSEYNEQEAFRCLSCFSYFIPTGNGFKLFQCFGDSNEKYSLIDPQDTPEPSKNWFISLFASGRKKTETSEEGNAGIYHSKADDGRQPNSSTGQNSDTPLPTTNHTAPSNITDIMKINSTKPDQNESQSPDVSVEGPLLAGKPQWGTNNKPDITNGNKTVDQKNGPGQSIGASLLDQSFLPGKASATGSQDTDKGAIISSTEEQIMFGSISYGAIGKSDNAVWKTSSGGLSIKHEITSSLPTTQLPSISTSNGKIIESEISQTQNIGIASIFTSEKADMNFKDKTDGAIGKPTIGGHAITVEEVNSVVEAQAAQVVSAEAENLLGSRTTRNTKQWEIMKSMVYGGLMESITSVGVVSSAVGANTATLNVFALGLANLIGGLFVIIHNLVELKKGQHTEDATRLSEREEDRYHALLGRRQNFPLHITVAILSYLLFGSLPPVIYGFSFRTNDRDLKLAAAAVASLISIAILAFAKAHVRRPPKTYFKTIVQFVLIGVSASGVSYLAGRLIHRLMEKLGWFNVDPSFSLLAPGTTYAKSGWAFY